MNSFRISLSDGEDALPVDYDNVRVIIVEHTLYHQKISALKSYDCLF